MNRMTSTRSLVFALLALCAGASEACRAPPPRQLIGVDEQVRTAADVAVGQVIGATPLGDGVVEYRFLVLEQLAGPAQKTFTVLGGPEEPGDRDSSFNNHGDFAFWAHGGGRTMNGADCVIRPSFVVGNSYLVFLGATPTWRSFEKIDMAGGRIDPGDKWLAYVKETLAGTPVNHDGTPDYERVGRFIYAFHRVVSLKELDRKALAAQHAPDALLLRAGHLADEFDRIVRNHARIPDAQFAATLREASGVGAALEAWRNGAGR